MSILHAVLDDLEANPTACERLRALLTDETPRGLLTPAEAAERLGVHQKTLTRAAAAGRVVGATRARQALAFRSRHARASGARWHAAASCSAGPTLGPEFGGGCDSGLVVSAFAGAVQPRVHLGHTVDGAPVWEAPYAGAVEPLDDEGLRLPVALTLPARIPSGFRPRKRLPMSKLLTRDGRSVGLKRWPAIAPRLVLSWADWSPYPDRWDGYVAEFPEGPWRPEPEPDDPLGLRTASGPTFSWWIPPRSGGRRPPPIRQPSEIDSEGNELFMPVAPPRRLPPSILAGASPLWDFLAEVGEPRAERKLRAAWSPLIEIEPKRPGRPPMIVPLDVEGQPVPQYGSQAQFGIGGRRRVGFEQFDSRPRERIGANRGAQPTEIDEDGIETAGHRVEGVITELHYRPLDLEHTEGEEIASRGLSAPVKSPVDRKAFKDADAFLARWGFTAIGQEKSDETRGLAVRHIEACAHRAERLAAGYGVTLLQLRERYLVGVVNPHGEVQREIARQLRREGHLAQDVCAVFNRKEAQIRRWTRGVRPDARSDVLDDLWGQGKDRAKRGLPSWPMDPRWPKVAREIEHDIRRLQVPNPFDRDWPLPPGIEPVSRKPVDWPNIRYGSWSKRRAITTASVQAAIAFDPPSSKSKRVKAKRAQWIGDQLFISTTGDAVSSSRCTLGREVTKESTSPPEFGWAHIRRRPPSDGPDIVYAITPEPVRIERATVRIAVDQAPRGRRVKRFPTAWSAWKATAP